MLRHLLTGAPGTGKTTVVDRLADRFDVVREPAREVIAAHRAETGEKSLDGRPAEFVDRLLERSIENYEAAAESVTIFDRGIPDCAAYALVSEVDPLPSLKVAEELRYAPAVFLFPPWEEVYDTDDMRLATFDQTLLFHEAVVTVYQELGYDLVEVPLTSVTERVEFIATRV